MEQILSSRGGCGGGGSFISVQQRIRRLREVKAERRRRTASRCSSEVQQPQRVVSLQTHVPPQPQGGEGGSPVPAEGALGLKHTAPQCPVPHLYATPAPVYQNIAACDQQLGHINRGVQGTCRNKFAQDPSHIYTRETGGCRGSWLRRGLI